MGSFGDDHVPSSEVTLGDLKNAVARLLAAADAPVAAEGGQSTVSVEPLPYQAAAYASSGVWTPWEANLLPLLQSAGNVGSIGAWIEYLVDLKAGTYALCVHVDTGTYGGQAKASLNGVDIDQPPYGASSAAFDTYSAAGKKPILVVASDVTIPETGSYAVRFTVTGKNASATEYYVGIFGFSLSTIDA